MKITTVGEHMRPGLASCNPEATGAQMARALASTAANELAVLHGDGRPLGVITGRDLALSLLRAPPIRATDLMSTPVITIDVDAPIDDAVDLMRTHQIRRVLVTNQYGVVVGIIGVDELATAGPPGVERLAEVLSAQALRRRVQRPG